jgi:hypothetical protein
MAVRLKDFRLIFASFANPTERFQHNNSGIKIKIIKGYWLKTGMISIIKLSRDKNVD